MQGAALRALRALGVTFEEAKTVFYDENALADLTPSRRSCPAVIR